MQYNNFNQGGGFNDFQNNNAQQHQYNSFKAQNTPLQSGFVPPAQPAAGGAADPAPWRKFTKRFNPNLSVSVDKEKDQLAKCGVTDAT